MRVPVRTGFDRMSPTEFRYVGDGPREREERERSIRLLTDQLETAKSQVSRHSEQLATLRKGQTPTSQRLVSWIRSIPAGMPIEAFSGTVELPKFKDHVAGVEQLRQQLRELEHDLQRCRTAPYPRAVAADRVRSFVDAMAQRGEPDTLRCLDLARDPAFATTSVEVYGVPNVRTVDAAALICWAFKDVITDKMLALVDELAGPETEALTDDQREQRAEEIEAQLLFVERREEHLIMLAEEIGQIIPRRDNADSRAVLGLQDTLPAPAR
jgi:hypothetical protein